MHIDLDYFFAQCEEVKKPELKAKPVVVCVYSGRTEDSGVVSTANYMARKYDVRSGIPIKLAKSRLAEVPDAVFLPLDVRYYSEMSEAAMSAIESFAQKIERVGIDECYVDASDLVVSLEDASGLAQQIKDEVKNLTNLTCSIGVGPNKMLAKIASDIKKPDGLTIIGPEKAASLISKMGVEKIPGVGPKTRTRLLEMGVRTVGELASLDSFKLLEAFGKKTGTFMFNAARGIDEEPVKESEGRKQIGRIVTLKGDATTSEEMYPELYKLCESVFSTAADRKVSFKTVGVILILQNLDQRSKSRTLKTHSNNFETLHSTARSILDEAMGQTNKSVRRLGVRLSEFQSTTGQDTISHFMGG